MKYIRTRKATDWPKKEDAKEKIIRLVLFFIPEANPGYRGRFHLIHEWIIEFNDKGEPGREIGLDVNGKVVLAGPDEENYGYWLDTNMTINDFENIHSSEEEFSKLWNSWLESNRQVA